MPRLRTSSKSSLHYKHKSTFQAKVFIKTSIPYKTFTKLVHCTCHALLFTVNYTLPAKYFSVFHFVADWYLQTLLSNIFPPPSSRPCLFRPPRSVVTRLSYRTNSSSTPSSTSFSPSSPHSLPTATVPTFYYRPIEGSILSVMLLLVSIHNSVRFRRHMYFPSHTLLIFSPFLRRQCLYRSRGVKCSSWMFFFQICVTGRSSSRPST